MRKNPRFNHNCSFFIDPANEKLLKVAWTSKSGRSFAEHKITPRIEDSPGLFAWPLEKPPLRGQAMAFSPWSRAIVQRAEWWPVISEIAATFFRFSCLLLELPTSRSCSFFELLKTAERYQARQSRIVIHCLSIDGQQTDRHNRRIKLFVV